MWPTEFFQVVIALLQTNPFSLNMKR